MTQNSSERAFFRNGFFSDTLGAILNSPFSPEYYQPFLRIALSLEPILKHSYGIFVTLSLLFFFRHFSEWLLPAPSCEPFYFLGTDLGEQGDAVVGHLDININ